MLVWMPDLLVDLAKNLLQTDVYDTIECYGYSQMRGRYTPTKPTKTTEWDGLFSPMKIHCIDYAFQKLCDENPPTTEKNFLSLRRFLIDTTAFDLPKKYVVLTTGYTAEVREWRPEFINVIIDYLKLRDIVPVFLGNSSAQTGGHSTIDAAFKTEINFEGGVNLIDKTTLTEAAAIMHDSLAVLGVDNGLLHVAGTTAVPIVGGFTTVSPWIRMPVRQGSLGWNYYPVYPDESLDCKFCQQTTNFIYGHDYKNCLHKTDPEMEAKVNICTKQMTAKKFIYWLEEILA